MLIQNVYNKIIEAHNIVTGKVDPELEKRRLMNKKAADEENNNKSGECKKEENDTGGGDQKPKTPAQERRSSFRKTTSTDDSAIKKRSQQPDPLDIYKLNGLGGRPMTRDDFMLGGNKDKANGGSGKVAPQSQEAKCYIGADKKINFGKLLTDEVLAADHKLVETVKKMVSTSVIWGAAGERRSNLQSIRLLFVFDQMSLL